MQNYLIEGVSGTGKTSVCQELRRRGFHAVDGDNDLAYQGNPETGEPTDVPSHWHHLWNVDRVRALVADQGQRLTFFCGGSRDLSQLLAVFDAVFVLKIDRTGEDTPANGVRIDATAPLAHVVDQILGHAAATELLSASSVAEWPGDFVRRCGTVLAEFGPSTQDSGNVSFLVDVGPRLLFVKTAGVPGAAPPGSPTPNPSGPRTTRGHSTTHPWWREPPIPATSKRGVAPPTLDGAMFWYGAPTLLGRSSARCHRSAGGARGGPARTCRHGCWRCRRPSR